jgi:nucleotide-binding universal stress UspA family protein
MYRKIMVPVDLEHISGLAKALNAAGDLATHYQAEVCYVGITAQAPSSIAHNLAEYTSKLEGFARSEAGKYGHQATAKAYPSHDPSTDLDNLLLAAVKDVGADLVVMASHVPGLADHLWPSHGGKLASHSGVSVFLVR